MPKGLNTHIGDEPFRPLTTGPKAQQPASKKNRVRKSGIAATVAAGLMLSGCASPIIGALTIGEIASIAGLVSTFMSGQDLTEHALSAATGKDCRILEAMLRSERDFCVEHSDSATDGDFEGVIALFDEGQGSTTTLASADTDRGLSSEEDLIALGFAPIDRGIARDRFALETASAAPEERTRQPVSFGMLQASYGQSWSYELTTRRDGSRYAQSGTNRQLASAEPQALPGTRTDGAVILPEPVAN
ncbi:MAG: hypothetical protein P1U69_17725 [Parvibaculaceae bacterium]|nr:hypothetical protein [Parvibaculaceae bacterium]HBM89248.1 hypothetical protein [Rhodobiaceae bacterium]